MFWRTLLLLISANHLVAQNNLIIYSINAVKFSVHSSVNAKTDSLVYEIKLKNIQQDSLHLNFSIGEEKFKYNALVYLLSKGDSVKHQDFIYSLEFDKINKKARLNYINTYSSVKLPSPLLPEKPLEDTSYKWRNNVYGNVYELKNGKAFFMNNIPKEGSCVIATANENIAFVIQLIARTQIESEKFSHCRQLVKNNCISTQQLTQLFNVINFELDKLKLFKEAYQTLVDKNNVPALSDAFKFQSSKKEFNDIINNPNSLVIKNKIICITPLIDSVFIQLLSELRLFSTDYEKQQYLKEKANNQCFNCNQFKQLLSPFIHDREKLDIAKVFYNNITDKENLSSLNDVFSYNESKANLTEYLKSQN